MFETRGRKRKTESWVDISEAEYHDAGKERCCATNPVVDRSHLSIENEISGFD